MCLLYPIAAGAYLSPADVFGSNTSTQSSQASYSSSFGADESIPPLPFNDTPSPAPSSSSSSSSSSSLSSSSFSSASAAPTTSITSSSPSTQFSPPPLPTVVYPQPSGNSPQPYVNQAHTSYIATPTRSNAPKDDSQSSLYESNDLQENAPITVETGMDVLHSGAPMMISSGPETLLVIGAVLLAFGVTVLQLRRRLEMRKS